MWCRASTMDNRDIQRVLTLCSLVADGIGIYRGIYH